MHWLAFALAPVGAIPVGLILGLAVMRRIRQSKWFRIGALLAASLFSFVTYRDPGERARVEETESETRRKREEGIGDPPDVEGPD
jgi:hypothetical protein